MTVNESRSRTHATTSNTNSMRGGGTRCFRSNQDHPRHPRPTIVACADNNNLETDLLKLNLKSANGSSADVQPAKRSVAHKMVRFASTVACRTLPSSPRLKSTQRHHKPKRKHSCGVQEELNSIRNEAPKSDNELRSVFPGTTTAYRDPFSPQHMNSGSEMFTAKQDQRSTQSSNAMDSNAFDNSLSRQDSMSSSSSCGSQDDVFHTYTDSRDSSFEDPSNTHSRDSHASMYSKDSNCEPEYLLVPQVQPSSVSALPACVSIQPNRSVEEQQQPPAKRRRRLQRRNASGDAFLKVNNELGVVSVIPSEPVVENVEPFAHFSNSTHNGYVRQEQQYEVNTWLASLPEYCVSHC